MVTDHQQSDPLQAWLQADYRIWCRRWWWLTLPYAWLYLSVILFWLPELLALRQVSLPYPLYSLIYNPVTGPLYEMSTSSPLLLVIIAAVGLTLGFGSLPHLIRRQDWLIAYGPRELAARLEARVRKLMGIWVWLIVLLVLLNLFMTIAILTRQGISVEFTVIHAVMQICCIGLAVEIAIRAFLRFRPYIFSYVAFQSTFFLLILIPENLFLRVSVVLPGFGYKALVQYLYAVVIILACLVVTGLIARSSRRSFARVSQE